MKLLLNVLLCLLLVGGCTSGFASMPKMEVEIDNQSSRDLQNAVARFGKYDCEWGYVGKTFSKSYLFYPYPITPKAELHWEENGKHRVEKLDLSQICPPGKSGRLTFTVRDRGVEVSFRESSSAK